MTTKIIGSKTDQQAVLGVLKGVREAWEANDAVPSEGMVRATWVLAKRDGRWHVAAYHYSAAN